MKYRRDVKWVGTQFPLFFPATTAEVWSDMLLCNGERLFCDVFLATLFSSGITGMKSIFTLFQIVDEDHSLRIPKGSCHNLPGGRNGLHVFFFFCSDSIPFSNPLLFDLRSVLVIHSGEKTFKVLRIPLE